MQPPLLTTNKEIPLPTERKRRRGYMHEDTTSNKTTVGLPTNNKGRMEYVVGIL
jgi:hypothetical protein